MKKAKEPINRDLLLVAIALGTWGLGESMFLMFQPLYLQKMGADPLKIGTILGACGVLMAIAHIPAGYLADRLGRRPLMWISWMLGLIATWVMALAGGLALFVPGLLLYSMTSFVMAPLNSYITAARGRWRVGRAITLIHAAYNIGAFNGPWLAGLLSDRLGLRSIYYVAGVIFIFSCAVILFIRPQPVSSPTPEQARSGIALGRPFYLFMAVVFITMFSTYLPQPLSPNFLQNVHQLTYGQIGWLGSISCLGIVILNLVLGHIDARRGFLLAQACVGVFALILMKVNGMIWFGLAYFMVGGYRTARSLATAQAGLLVNTSRLGLAYGILESVNASTYILAPPLAGLIYSRNPTGVYAFSLGLIVASILVSAWLLPKPQTRQTELLKIANEREWVKENK